MKILLECKEDNTNQLIYQNLPYLLGHIWHDAYIYNYDIQHTDWKTVPFCDMSYTFHSDPWWGKPV